MCQYPFSARGFAPDPAGGADDASPDPLVGWRGVPLPIPFLPWHFRRPDLFSVPTAPRFLSPTNKKVLDTPMLLGRRGPEWFSCRGETFEVTPLGGL